jgi:hypothetical protein
MEAEIVKEKNKDKSRELEIRIKVSPNDWQLVKSKINILSEHHIFSFIKQVDDRFRRKEIEIIGNNQIIQNIEKKSIISTTNDLYKIDVSTETRINDEIKISETDFVRFKHRFSGELNEKWKIDLTIANVIMKTDYNNLKSHKESFLANKLITRGMVYELELEYNSDSDACVEDINRAIKTIYEMMGESVNYEMVNVMTKIKRKIRSEKRDMTIKGITNNPRTINQRIYYNNLFPHYNKYMVCEKSDGVRCIVYCDGKNKWIVNDKEVINGDSTLDAIFDGEYIDGKVYIFDVLYFDGKLLVDNVFDERWNIISSNRVLIEKDGIMIKNMKRIDNIKDDVLGVWNAKYDYEIDGLIFTPLDETYFKMVVYKWKPADKSTIDFLVVRCPDDKTGIKPLIKKPGYDLYLLFSSVDRETLKIINLRDLPFSSKILPPIDGDRLSHIHFSPSINSDAYIYYHPLDGQDINGKIVEMIWKSGEWHIAKIREDRKKHGNHFRVAEFTFTEYINPFGVEQLYTQNNSYFRVNKKREYVSITKYHRFISWENMKKIIGAELIYDLACGKGQDLLLYHEKMVKNIMCAEIDRSAIEELITRKYQIYDEKLHNHAFDVNHRMGIQVRCLDLNRPYEESRNVLYVKDGNAVIINFAIHYLIKDGFDNIFQLVDGLTRKGGLFIFTCLNGEDVRALPDNWEIVEQGKTKYGINKIDDKTIEVIHPFSDGKYYEEPIVDVEKLMKYFTDRGWGIVECKSFRQYMGEYRGLQLSDGDKSYSQLYYTVILSKGKSK